MQCMFPKAVRVRKYARFRYERWEVVREHCRSFPHQLTLFND
jgi:hypothetical protein